ncbi:DUF3017 domain-containing protein [Streptomyces lavendofoliae]|uniref:DUF3017 domain-containing protein n=1 Tax=Streptomyces lavendofoliae TaxID=67314 RepID=A0A918HXR7_9ACTN|nr:DUF3017 domain-containing protein [Streptomyces lavendofoliae]GGU35668.1 hypothetical protein GCM10010274_23680 [Streptomyces lavendofoliae]
MGVRANDESATPARPAGAAADAAGRPAAPGPATGPAPSTPGPDAPSGAPAGGSAPGADAHGPGAPSGRSTPQGDAPRSDAPSGGAEGDAAGRPEPRRAAAGSRRPPTVTRDTARPEGGGRAAPGDAPAPARQWPLLTVLGVTALGLLVVGFDPFPQASRIGAMLIGLALLTGAALRRTLPSVGMLAVRSRFTDMAAYGVLGTGIVLLSLMTQPDPWLEIPFLEDAVRFAVR